MRHSCPKIGDYFRIAGHADVYSLSCCYKSSQEKPLRPDDGALHEMCWSDDPAVEVMRVINGATPFYHRPWELIWHAPRSPTVNYDAEYEAAIASQDLFNAWESRDIKKFGPLSAHQRLRVQGWLNETETRILADQEERQVSVGRRRVTSY
jgi:hypothetical protein